MWRGFRTRALDAFHDLVRRVGDPHAFTAAAGRGLDHDRIADLFRDTGRLLGRGDRAEKARHHRDARFGRDALRGDFVTHGVDGFWIRPDEANPGVAKCLCERTPFG